MFLSTCSRYEYCVYLGSVIYPLKCHLTNEGSENEHLLAQVSALVPDRFGVLVLAPKLTTPTAVGRLAIEVILCWNTFSHLCNSFSLDKAYMDLCQILACDKSGKFPNLEKSHQFWASSFMKQKWTSQVDQWFRQVSIWKYLWMAYKPSI